MDKQQQQEHQAKIMAGSTMVPKMYQGNPTNCLMAIQSAEALGIDSLMFAQQTYEMGGKPAMTAKLQIALGNASPRILGGLRWVVDGPNYWCEATERETNIILVGPVVNMDIAKAEGWTRNRKYASIPDMMLRYRAASFFINMYLPERTMGLRTVEEAEDIMHATAPGEVEAGMENLPPELGGPDAAPAGTLYTAEVGGESVG